MNYVQIERDGNLARVILERGKVNALNPQVISELQAALRELESDDAARALVLTGVGPFFSFGFDVPEFMSYEREAFTEYLRGFTALTREIYLYPKPVVAALNGHAIAGGCILATACDRRIMVTGKAGIGLNEVTLGASLFASSVAILRHLVGQQNAERIILRGELHDPEDAAALGLVDRVCAPEKLHRKAAKAATQLSEGDADAFGSLKRLLRRPIAEKFQPLEENSIREFVDIWYGDDMRRRLEQVKIR